MFISFMQCVRVFLYYAETKQRFPRKKFQVSGLCNGEAMCLL
jgi:hypothetical protein